MVSPIWYNWPSAGFLASHQTIKRDMIQ